MLCLAISILAGTQYSEAFIRHEVKRNETLWGLAHFYKVSPEAIIQANPEVATGLKTGMVIQIPEEKDLESLKDKTAESKETVTEQQTITTPIQEKVEMPVQEIVEAPKEEIIEEMEEDNREDFDQMSPIEEQEMSSESGNSTFENPTLIINSGFPSTDERVYVAKFGDTLSSIAVKTGYTLPELIHLNPLLGIEQLPEGTVVRLTSEAPYTAINSTNTVVDSIVYRITPVVDESIIASQKNRKTIALMLPFDAEGESISRQSMLATDFYKGFLMAVHKNLGLNDTPINILAIDTQCTTEELMDKLNNLIDENINIIIPPDDEKQLEIIEEYAINNNIVVLNTLNVKDEGYIKYPNVAQGNINQKLMYDKAINVLLNEYGDYTPVILDLYGGKEEKISFVEELKKQYKANNRLVENLVVKENLEEDDLNSLDSTKKYIFIPKSGSQEVFNRIYATLVVAKEEDIINDRYKVFGYPDWIVFSGESSDALHRMGAIIYSRFYMDRDDREVIAINDEWLRWYGSPMEEAFPVQGILGYDTGNLLFNSLNKKWIESDIDKLSNGTYGGLQSTFHFIHDGNENGGLINDALYIIEYLPGDYFSARKF